VRSTSEVAKLDDPARLGVVHGEALDCGHFLPEEQPGPVVEQLTRFFSSP